MDNKIRCHVVGEYYDIPKLRTLAKDLKAGKPEAVQTAAKVMAPLVPQNAVLVPIPSHKGRAQETLALVQALSNLTGTRVRDIIVGNDRESSYDLKKKGVILSEEDMGFKLKEPFPDGENCFLVDNVVATGNTARAVAKLLPEAQVLALAVDSKADGRRPDVVIERILLNEKKIKKMPDMENKQGVIMVKSQDTVIAADFYRKTEQKERIWKNWIDVTIDKSLNGQKEYTISEYPAKLSRFKELSDKQIGFVLQDEKPVREINSLQAAFVRRFHGNEYDSMTVSSFIEEHPDLYANFIPVSNPILERLNTCKEAEKLEIEEYSRIRRIFAFKEYLNFNGTERIQSPGDVADLFSFLQDRSVENAFAVMTRGNESMVLHLGIGCIRNVSVDVNDIRYAAERFGAEKVWFVHNHPSGKLYASADDVKMHAAMKQILGKRLQNSIIINTDSGWFGQFSERVSVTCQNGWYREGNKKNRVIPIPVYSFDKTLFLKKGEQKYSFKDTQDVAEFLATQRLGKRYKYSMLATNTTMQLNGYYHLPFSDIKNVPVQELAEQIITLATYSQSRGCMIVSNDKGELLSMADKVNEEINRLSNSAIQLIDVVNVEKNGNTVSWQCQRDFQMTMGQSSPTLVATREDISQKYNESQDNISEVIIQPTGSGMFATGRISCKINGERQMFKDLELKEFHIWATLADTGKKMDFARQLAARYFSGSQKQQETQEKGLAR